MKFLFKLKIINMLEYDYLILDLCIIFIIDLNKLVKVLKNL